MTKRVFILPYKKGSASARSLSKATGWKRLKLHNSRYRPRSGDVIINWGNSSNNNDYNLLNSNLAVSICSNKLKFFTELYPEIGEQWLPDFTTFKTEAKTWIEEGHKVCCRTKLQGHSGDGLVIASTEEELVDCRLYTKYFAKKEEYRVHCYKDNNGMYRILDHQRKGRKIEISDIDVNWQVRTHDHGFVYCREDVELPEKVIACALNVFKETGLDFGAVDVLYKERKDEAVCVEVNTAVGLEGTTLDKYVGMFKEIVR